MLQANPNFEPACDAATPLQLPLTAWRPILKRTFWHMISERLSLVAAGCGFYAMLALFPAISTLIFLYGLVFDPVTVEPQMRALQTFLPAAAFTLIDDRVRILVSTHNSQLTIGLSASVAIALWSAASGTKSMLGGLNVAYGETETRGFLHYQVLTIGLTFFGTLAVALAIAVLVFLPAAFQFAGIDQYGGIINRSAGYGLLLAAVFSSILILYRIGPCRRQARWAWVLPGAIIATLFWLLVSEGLSYYVTHVASYSMTYGSLGTVIIVMMWFYLSAYVVMLGAELNAQMELQTTADTTIGPARPMGERGAAMADSAPPV
jgi:membrane protein